MFVNNQVESKKHKFPMSAERKVLGHPHTGTTKVKSFVTDL